MTLYSRPMDVYGGTKEEDILLEEGDTSQGRSQDEHHSYKAEATTDRNSTSETHAISKQAQRFGVDGEDCDYEDREIEAVNSSVGG